MFRIFARKAPIVSIQSANSDAFRIGTAFGMDCAGEFWRTSQRPIFRAIPKWVQARLIGRHIRRWMPRHNVPPTLRGLAGSWAAHRIAFYLSFPTT